ncbi:hypothetical protein [Kamptonema sp. UHCC 0994]|uniref:hypothetical protein n=1 Tax=Kamptonema sp. UHCC 0994 TaxID=3031329 RepID=UPI0023B8DAB1|nr:hypothetical protein [Kamptonema sp. UHCC 0994]MDF0553867.1 hypothetical protein [Kamptonema sp. UHCC 0994]
MKIRDVTDKRLISLAQRQQRLYDRTKFALALQAAKISDIERFLAKDGFFKRSDLPEAGLPSDEEDTEM